MLKIRLTRTGKKKQPSYRIVVAEHTAPIQGKFIAIVGNYNPFSKKVVLNKEEIEKWMNNGAKPSNTIAKILQKEGLKHPSIVIKKFAAKSKKQLEAEKKIAEEEKAKEAVEKEAKKAEFEQELAEKAAEKEEETKNEPATDENAEAPKEENKEPEQKSE